MKKLIALILCIMLFALPALSEEDAQNWYLENAWKQVRILDLMVSDEAYALIYPSFEDQKKRITYSIPDSMPENYEILDAGALAEAVQPILVQSGLSDELVRHIMRGMPNALLMQANARFNVDWLGFTSAFRTSESVVVPDIDFSPVLVVFDFAGDAIPVVVVSEAGEGVANFSACFVMREALASVSDFDALIGEME